MPTMKSPPPASARLLPLTVAALLVLFVSCMLSGCGRSQPDKRETAASAKPVAPAPRVPKPTPIQPQAAATPSPLAAELAGARGDALCKLAERVDPARDAALLGPALDQAFALRRDEEARDCTFALLRALQANARLLELAQQTTDEARWLAIVFHANRNLRARHYEVYGLAQAVQSQRVHHAVAGGLGAYGPQPEVLSLLGKALDHRNENVRLKAARSLIEIGGDDALELLRQRAKVEKDKAVIVTMHRALNKP